MSSFSGLEFRSDYWRDEQARAAHKRFLQQIHGLDLQRWEDAGCWDYESYLPFSFFDREGEVVATVCLFLMDLVVAGREQRVAQFSGVGTAPDLRRRGLANWLSQKALQTVSDDTHGHYLFADEMARPFYQQMGFRSVLEYRPLCALKGESARPGARKLDPGNADDMKLLQAMASRRLPVSQLLGSRTPSLFLFHCLYTMADCAYLLPTGAIVFAKRRGELLEVFDLASEGELGASSWLPWLQHPELRYLRFHFMPDEMGIAVQEWQPIPDSGCHILAPFTMPGQQALFPFSAHA